MGMKAFLAQLAAIASQYTWTVDHLSGEIRGHTAEPGPCQPSYCPITALARSLTGKTWDLSDWESASYEIDREIGLPCEQARWIVAAANGVEWVTVDSSTVTPGSALLRAVTLRAALLAAVGLDKEL